MLKIPHFEFPSAPHCTQHQWTFGAALLLCLSSHIRPRTSYLVPCPSVHRFVPVVIKLFIMAAYRANQYHVCRLSRAIDKTGRQTESVEGRKKHIHIHIHIHSSLRLRPTNLQTVAIPTPCSTHVGSSTRHPSIQTHWT